MLSFCFAVRAHSTSDVQANVVDIATRLQDCSASWSKRYLSLRRKASGYGDLAKHKLRHRGSGGQPNLLKTAQRGGNLKSLSRLSISSLVYLTQTLQCGCLMLDRIRIPAAAAAAVAAASDTCVKKKRDNWRSLPTCQALDQCRDCKLLSFTRFQTPPRASAHTRQRNAGLGNHTFHIFFFSLVSFSLHFISIATLRYATLFFGV